MTDERMGDALWAAVARLPRGSGIVFRHYATPPAERADLWRRLAKAAQRRRLVLVWAGGDPPGGARAVHNRGRAGALRTASAHDRREALAAIAGGADALFVSPVFATRSHPGARALGVARFGLLIRDLGVPVIALGGMNERRGRTLAPLKIHGWAGIDAWL